MSEPAPKLAIPTRVCQGRAMLGFFYGLRSMTISKIAEYYEVTAGEAVDLMCEAMEYDRQLLARVKKEK